MKLSPRLKPYFSFKETIALLNPLNKSGAVQNFEKAFASKFECDYATMFAHGRSGIYALLKAWNLKDVEVICPAYTCVVVQHAIVLSGNIPVFVDSSKDSWNMNLKELEEEINAKTKVIIATHLFGYPMDVEHLENIVKQAENKYGNKIYVIQDVAHSYGARWKGELVTKYGDAAIFGMNISKILSSIFGGMVICKDKNLDQKLKDFRSKNMHDNRFVKSLKRIAYYIAARIAFNSYIYGLINWMERKGLLNAFVKYYEEDKIQFPSDWDSIPTNIEAVVGLIQLKKYDQIIAQRQKNALQWKSTFRSDDSIQFMDHIEGSTYSHCVALVKNREEWIEDYRKQGMQLGILIEYSVPEMTAFKKYKRREYPNSKYFSEHSINFPNWPGIIAD